MPGASHQQGTKKHSSHQSPPSRFLKKLFFTPLSPLSKLFFFHPLPPPTPLSRYTHPLTLHSPPVTPTPEGGEGATGTLGAVTVLGAVAGREQQVLGALTEPARDRPDRRGAGDSQGIKAILKGLDRLVPWAAALALGGGVVAWALVVLGLRLFAGRFHACSCPTLVNPQGVRECTGWQLLRPAAGDEAAAAGGGPAAAGPAGLASGAPTSVADGLGVLMPCAWVAPAHSFDSVPLAVLALLHVASLKWAVRLTSLAPRWTGGGGPSFVVDTPWGDRRGDPHPGLFTIPLTGPAHPHPGLLTIPGTLLRGPSSGPV